MRIDLPATLTAHIDIAAEDWQDPDSPVTAQVVVSFGGEMVTHLEPIRPPNFDYVDQWQKESNEEIAQETMAHYLRKMFEAVSERGKA